MALDPEIRLSLHRIENALQNKLELRDFRHFMLAKSYLEEGQIHTAMQFLKRIDKYAPSNAQRAITQSLFIRALILIYNLQFTDALALLIRIRRMELEKDDKMMSDIQEIIRDIKIQQHASTIYNTVEGREKIEIFRENTVAHLQHYLTSAKELVRR
ncbi:MAG: hypothetical protein ACFE9L_01705 [Candidatus Hodarchaeota archaeon]